MTYHIEIETLLDELIRLIASPSLQSHPKKLNTTKDYALHVLRQQNFARTNQFDVESQLNGLDEKFRIYGRDKLADALIERRSILYKNETKFTSEILHFLLEISHRPVSDLEYKFFDSPKESNTSNDLPLQWSDVLDKETLSKEKEIWENVNFVDTGSDDEYEFEITKLVASENNSSLDNRPKAKTKNLQGIIFLNSKDNDGLKILRESQFWQKIPNVNGIRMETIKKSITELQAIREVLFMLGGYPTTLFKINSQTSVIIEASKDYALQHVSHDCFMNILRTLASQGTITIKLRLWVKSSQVNPLLQAFQLAILEWLDKFDVLLSEIHQRFLSPSNNTVVSLLKVWQEITPTVSFLTHLVEITRIIEQEPNQHAFLYLEMLYNLTCTSQMAGDDAIYSNIGKVFFHCFLVYLRPIRAWIEDGELRKDDPNFFVRESIENVELSSLWETRFKVRKTKDDVLHVPCFLRHVAYRIFNTGKSIVLLKYLNQASLLQTINRSTEPPLDFETVCKPATFQLVPFMELFNISFDAWVSSKHQYAASLLKDTLFNSCGLHASLDALSHIYFLADGSIGSLFVATIFKNLDNLKTSWNDRFTLTECARNKFSLVSSVLSERLHVSMSSLAQNHQNLKKSRKSVKVFTAIELKYQLSWPIQIIITPMAMPLYQRIFIFLLQVRRTSEILTRETSQVDRLNCIYEIDEKALYYSLRMRLIWFTQTIYYYLTSLVLEPCTQKMKTDLRAAEDVDMMINVHVDYIKKCIDQSLLGKNLEIIYSTVMNVLDLGICLRDARLNNDAVTKFTLNERNSLMDLSIAGLGLYTTNHHYRQQEHQKSDIRSPRYNRRHYTYNNNNNNRKWNDDSSSDDDYSYYKKIKKKENNLEIIDNDLSILRSPSKLSSDNFEDDNDHISVFPYISQLRHLKATFNRHVRFIANGLKGVARATTNSEEARLWDTLSDMLEIGLIE
ncbi:Gamma-tubulin complex component 2 [Erysiphe necator]|nr:Gamma-tubulin complex component 2 [Erysiphe necator]